MLKSLIYQHDDIVPNKAQNDQLKVNAHGKSISGRKIVLKRQKIHDSLFTSNNSSDLSSRSLLSTHHILAENSESHANIRANRLKEKFPVKDVVESIDVRFDVFQHNQNVSKFPENVRFGAILEVSIELFHLKNTRVRHGAQGAVSDVEN